MSQHTWGTAAHLEWLDTHRAQLLSFYEPHVVDPEGGYFWLDDRGLPRPEQGKALWITARMVHCFSLAHLLGRDGAQAVAEHGIRELLGPAMDHRHGGWFAAIDEHRRDETKQLYGVAHVILAGSSAVTAGMRRGDALLTEALRVVDEHFWDEELGVGVDAADRTFEHVDPYRGLNANMHLTEAYLAAYEATGDEHLVDRALGLAERFVLRQLESGRPHAYRLVEHFDVDWQPWPEYNADEPAHPFRPYGSTPGHWLEWAKLCVQLAGLRDEPWLIPAARQLFDQAVAEAWLEPGGFAYTVDWEGRPVISNRFFWPVAEGIGAAHLLRVATGDDEYADWYERLWRFADDHLMDHEFGAWHSELDDELRPTKRTWDGKPDLYHVLQATLYARLPIDRGLAAQLRHES